MSLIYISYPRNVGRYPEWWNSLKSSASSAFVSYFDPTESMLELLEKNKSFAERVNKVSGIDMDAYRLPPQLGGSLLSSMPMIENGDTGLVAKTAVWRDLYVLMRSDLLLVDLDAYELGDRTMEMVYARLWNIPIIGISDQVTNSAAHVSMTDAIVSSNLENLIGMIGHKLSEGTESETEGTHQQEAHDEDSEESVIQLVEREGT